MTTKGDEVRVTITGDEGGAKAKGKREKGKGKRASEPVNSGGREIGRSGGREVEIPGDREIEQSVARHARLVERWHVGKDREAFFLGHGQGLNFFRLPQAARRLSGCLISDSAGMPSLP